MYHVPQVPGYVQVPVLFLVHVPYMYYDNSTCTGGTCTYMYMYVPVPGTWYHTRARYQVLIPGTVPGYQRYDIDIDTIQVADLPVVPDGIWY